MQSLQACRSCDSGEVITNTDKDLSVISASQTLIYRQGKAAPFTVTMEPQGRALRDHQLRAVPVG